MSAAAYRSRAGRARCIPAFLWQVLVCQLILLSRIAWAFFQKLRPICKVKITHTYTSKLNWKEVIIGRRRNVSVRVLFWRNFHKNFVLYHKQWGRNEIFLGEYSLNKFFLKTQIFAKNLSTTQKFRGVTSLRFSPVPPSLKITV